MSSSDEQQDTEREPTQDRNEPLERFLRPVGTSMFSEIAVTNLTVTISIYDTRGEEWYERTKYLALTHEEWRTLMVDGRNFEPEDYVDD